ncbi:MAG: glycosyltransferase [Spirochaetia bacterium]|nr:glycosyltransferase [Spirochaetia bacterium]
MFAKKIKVHQQENAVSVCVPVFNSEPYLAACLESVLNQTILKTEKIQLILVNDGSNGTDSNGLNCRQIFKSFLKQKKSFPYENNLNCIYLEHGKNKGLLEARRTAVTNADSLYTFILDSDDLLVPECLEKLFNEARTFQADIVHGKADFFYSGAEREKVLSEKEKALTKRISLVNENCLFNSETEKSIFNDWLFLQNHNGFLWGKLIKTSVYKDALEFIPPVFCTMAEDILQYFFIALTASSYKGINEIVYSYCADTGISSEKKITSLYEWEKVCSTSSVFTVLFDFLNNCRNNDFAKKTAGVVSRICASYCRSNIVQLEQCVAPEIKDEAYSILCSFWGKELIEKLKSL